MKVWCIVCTFPEKQREINANKNFRLFFDKARKEFGLDSFFSKEHECTMR
jgi:hypothetical protein